MVATQDGKPISSSFYSEISRDLETMYRNVGKSSTLMNLQPSISFGSLIDQSWNKNYLPKYSSYNQNIVNAIYQHYLRVNFLCIVLKCVDCVVLNCNIFNNV